MSQFVCQEAGFDGIRLDRGDLTYTETQGNLKKKSPIEIDFPIPIFIDFDNDFDLDDPNYGIAISDN